MQDALQTDAAAVRIARSQGAYDLALGETLLRLFQGDRLLQLGYAKQVDYARERLGVPARTMFFWTRLARGLAARPVLREAVAAGAVTPRKAMVVFPVAVGEEERTWTAAAMGATEAELRAAIGEPNRFEVETMFLRMTPGQQDRLDAAIEMAKATMGYAAARWQYIEAICQEWLGGFGAWVPEEDDSGAGRNPAPAAPLPIQRKAVERQLRAIGEAVAVIEGEPCSGDPLALDALLLRLLAGRRGFDAAFGALALRVVREGVPEVFGYRSVDEYSRERLGISPTTFRQRVWLERRMGALPELREALAAGRLTYTKALAVARDAKPGDVAERIAEACVTTWQQVERESTAREDRRNRAAGVRRLWGPRDAVGTVTDAIASAQAGFCVDAGEALARIADHFLEVWTVHLRRRPTKGTFEVLQRHGGLCAVPGCSRPAQHLHHVIYRSRGGSNDKKNLVGVCAVHHLRAIHGGHLTVTGLAGESLRWEFGTREVWVTKGDDDVRRDHDPARPCVPDVRRAV